MKLSAKKQTRRGAVAVLFFLSLLFGGVTRAQDTTKYSVFKGLPLKPQRMIRFTTTEASWTSLDVSPDGKKILFTSDRSGSENLWWIDAGKKDTMQVTKEHDQNFPSACWTPDGNYIVYSRGKLNVQLYLVHKNGGAGTQLISDPPTVKTIDPAVSPDGLVKAGALAGIGSHGEFQGLGYHWGSWTGVSGPSTNR